MSQSVRFPEFGGEWNPERLNDIAEIRKGVGISEECTVYVFMQYLTGH